MNLALLPKRFKKISRKQEYLGKYVFTIYLVLDSGHNEECIDFTIILWFLRINIFGQE